MEIYSNGHKVDTKPLMIYASVVSRDSVRILLILESLNGINVKCANIQNTYLNAKPKERFGSDLANILVLTREE